MCDKCGDLAKSHELEAPQRRNFLFAGASIAATPFLAGLATTANAQGQSPAQNLSATKARAWAANDTQARFSQIEIDRRAVGPKDVAIDIMYAGICHSDIHTVHGDWSTPTFPVVPGHEIVGRVRAVGSDVTKFKVGDFAGVGCMVASCGKCDNCLSDREQNCVERFTSTYNAPDKVSGGVTYGGYSTAIVVTEHFALRIPPGVNLAGMAPILCAGVTTYSPMRHWELKRGQRVGIIGLGGLGHMALKLAVSLGAETTVFTTSPGKIEDAKRLGAREAFLWSDEAALQRSANSFDLMIAAVPTSFDVQIFMNLLKLDATLVNVGALEPLSGFNGMRNAIGRKSLAGSLIGGIAETQEIVDYCAARNISADVELIRPDQINEAYSRVIGKDVRYRFVIDMTAA